MQKQNIQTVGVETLQAGLHRPEDMPAAESAVVHALAHGIEALGGDHQLIAVPRHQPAEDLLCLPLAVDIRTVEEVDPGLAASPIETRRLRFVRIAAERHGAETELRNLNACTTEPDLLHVIASLVHLP